MTELNILQQLEDLKKYKTLGTVEEISKRINEEEILKFYYCESEDEYYVGQRLETMYYANVMPKTFCLHFVMSRYLPWGKDNFPSEPKEILFTEWMNGYIKKHFKFV